MEQTRLLMGMPISVKILDASATTNIFNQVFDYFKYVDDTFSTYKDTSAISRINASQLSLSDAGTDVRHVLQLCDQTTALTRGYFDIHHHGRLDPSGLVKGWAINNAAHIISNSGFSNYFIDAGGDIQTAGVNHRGEAWRVGIRNPFNRYQNVKILSVSGQGVATSGTYIRGQHIYNPFQPDRPLTEIASLTVIGPNIYEADRFATAAFAMGQSGLEIIYGIPGLAGYMIDAAGVAVFTPNFSQYVVPD